MDRNALTDASLRELVNAHQVRLIKPPAPKEGEAASGRERAASRPLPAAAGANPNNMAPANRQTAESESGGIDWLQASVYGERAACWMGWMERLAEAKEMAQAGGIAVVELHELGEYAQVMHHGSGKGAGHCRYVLNYKGIRLEISDHEQETEGENRRALARVVIPGRAFLEFDLIPALELAEFALWSLGIVSNVATWEPSRVDVCADLPGESLENFVKSFGAYGEGCVTRAKYTAVHCNNRRPETCHVGKGDLQLRVYDKLAEVKNDNERLAMMVANRWGGVMPTEAVRAEYQVRREPLRNMGIVTVENLLDKLPQLCAYLSEKWCRVTGEDVDRSNSQRHDGSKLWRKVVETFQSWAGVGKALRRQTETIPCAAKATAQLYGWAKSLAVTAGVRDLSGTKNLVQKLFDLVDPVKYREELAIKADQYNALGKSIAFIPGIS